jgi:hypothetical protein
MENIPAGRQTSVNGGFETCQAPQPSKKQAQFSDGFALRRFDGTQAPTEESGSISF